MSVIKETITLPLKDHSITTNITVIVTIASLLYQLFKFPHLSNNNHNKGAIVTSYYHSNVTYNPITVERIIFAR